MAKGKVRKSQKKRGGKSRRIAKQQMATVKQTLSFKPGTQVFNTIYTIYNAALSNSTRAMKVAEAYQEYRINKVVIKWKPQQDTFAGGTTGSIPYLHYVVDKKGTFQNVPGLNFRSLRETGCKILRFDDKTLSLTIRSAVLTAVTTDTYNANANLQFTSTKISPWLSTNNSPLPSGPWTPNSVDHGGIVYGIEQDNVGSTGNLRFDCDIEVYYQFRKPRSMVVGPVLPIRDMDLDEGGADIQV